MKGVVDVFKECVQLFIEVFGGKGYKLVSLSVNSVGVLCLYLVMWMVVMKVDVSFGGVQVLEIEVGISQVMVNVDGVIEVQMF